MTEPLGDVDKRPLKTMVRGPKQHKPGGRRAPKTPQDAAAYAAWAIHRMAQGRLGVDEGECIVKLLREFSRLYELDALLKRVADLETRFKLNE